MYRKLKEFRLKIASGKPRGKGSPFYPKVTSADDQHIGTNPLRTPVFWGLKRNIPIVSANNYSFSAGISMIF
jgi:hypothetical protein